MNKIWCWGWILAVSGVVLYLIGLFSGEFSEMLSIGGLGLFWIGNSPAAIILFLLSFTCVLNAITVFVIGYCMERRKD